MKFKHPRFYAGEVVILTALSSDLEAVLGVLDSISMSYLNLFGELSFMSHDKNVTQIKAFYVWYIPFIISLLVYF